MTTERSIAAPTLIQQAGREIHTFFHATGPEYLNCDLRLALNQAAALVLLPFGVVVGLPIALAIACENNGPVMIDLEVVGKEGKEFQQHKFRSLGPDPLAEAQVWRAKTNPHPRASRLGQFLRRTSLDELPQLINIALGEMTFVGVRSPTRKTIEHWKSQPDTAAIAQEYERAITSCEPGAIHAGIPDGRGDLTQHPEQLMRVMTDFVDSASLIKEIDLFRRCIKPILTGRGAY